MLNLSEHLGDGIGAWFSETDVDFALPEKDDIFREEQIQALGSLNIEPEQVVNIRQVHGGTVLKMEEKFFPVISEDIPEADATITNVEGVALMVRTADCVPIFLYDPVAKCIGLVHAGWRSTKERIVCSGIEMMRTAYDAKPQDMRAVLGPGIRGCCYEVNQDRCMDFPEHMVPRSGAWHLDLPAVNRDQLLAAGVGADHIFDLEQCTCCDRRFFSYRRQGKDAGRHAAILRIKE